MANDIGLQYVQKLGIRAERSDKKLDEKLATYFKCRVGDEVKERMRDYLVIDKDGWATSCNYDKKNEDYEFAMLYSGSFDGDIIRKACNWIDANKEYYGDTILEIGCDCGFMTCFLGSIFPEKHIVAIDRCQNGINVARKNAEKFGLTNVKFICTDVMNLTDVSFDTVFSMRTIHENCNDGRFADYTLDLPELAAIAEPEKMAYVQKLCSLMKKNGTLICLEKLQRDAYLLAWIQSMFKCGVSFDPDSYQELDCIRLGESTPLQAIVASKDEDCTSYDPLQAFAYCCSKNIDFSTAEYLGWDAKVVYEVKRGEFLAGLTALDKARGVKQIYAVWTHKEDPTGLVVYTGASDGPAKVQFYDISQKAQAIKNAVDCIRNMSADPSQEVVDLKTKYGVKDAFI